MIELPPLKVYLVFFFERERDSKTDNNNEPAHDKINIMDMRPAKTQINLGIPPV